MTLSFTTAHGIFLMAAKRKREMTENSTAVKRARDLAKVTGSKNTRNTDKVLCWLGSKASKREFVARHFPEEVNLVVSTFFGSGAVEFYLLRTRASISVHGFDLHSALVTFWQAMLISSADVGACVARMLPRNRIVSKSEFSGMLDKITDKKVPCKASLTAARLWIVHRPCNICNLGSRFWQASRARILMKSRKKMIRGLSAFKPPEGVDQRLRMERKDCFESIKASPASALYNHHSETSFQCFTNLRIWALRMMVRASRDRNRILIVVVVRVCVVMSSYS